MLPRKHQLVGFRELPAQIQKGRGQAFDVRVAARNASFEFLLLVEHILAERLG